MIILLHTAKGGPAAYLVGGASPITIHEYYELMAALVRTLQKPHPARCKAARLAVQRRVIQARNKLCHGNIGKPYGRCFVESCLKNFAYFAEHQKLAGMANYNIHG